ncbi:MAG: HAD family hydrolase, partial [Actinobacteria bacterium]|nr:HAD family hydrolase [Actinomycetota bacterium]
MTAVTSGDAEGPDPSLAPGPPAVEAVLFDRDGTLVVDVPYNGDPTKVEIVPGAADALRRLRHAGLPLAVVSNQSGVARGWLTMEQVDAVNRRVDELLGPFVTFVVCPHGPSDGCECRKPRPGMVLAAAARLGVRPERCALVGDIGADVEAALAAGARPVLVPTPVTRPEEVAAAPEVATDLLTGVLAGFGLALARLLLALAGLSTRVEPAKDGARATVHLEGVATFLGIPR